jgi:ATP-dependent Clp protease adapter protein ClpS
MAPEPRDPASVATPGPDAALQKALAAASADAAQRRHRFVTLEHWFRAALDEPDAIDLIVRCGGDVDDMRRELDEYLELLEEVQPRAPLIHPRALAVVQHVAIRVLAAGRREVTLRDLLVALREVTDDYPAMLMRAAGIDRIDLLRVISHGTRSVRAAVVDGELLRVRVHNDDYTPMEFVVNVLRSVFRLPEAEAHTRMMEIHVQGSIALKVMSREQAIDRADQVSELAEAAGHPLRCSLEVA